MFRHSSTSTDHEPDYQIADCLTLGRCLGIYDEPITVHNTEDSKTYVVQYLGDNGQYWITPEYDTLADANRARKIRLRKGGKDVQILKKIIKAVSHRPDKQKN